MLEIQCPACQKRIAWDAEDPARFCQSCGAELPKPDFEGTPESTAEPEPPASVAPEKPGIRQPAESATIAPSQAPARPNTYSRFIGEMIGPYRLVRFIGAGGMGVVWEAVEVETGRRVAVKRLSTNMVTDDEYQQRFIREAQTVAKISHPNVTFIFGAGEQDGVPYIAMELMPGTTLADHVTEENPLDVRVGVDRILEAIEGLIAAHEVGVIHRDVKPSNCFLTSNNTVKIGDFGLSKSLTTTEVNLTKTGTFMGTPSYSAPEQIRGAELDIRTDVYAVGATLYNLLTGKNPFGGDALAVTAQIVSDKPEPPTGINSKIPIDLERIILKAIEKDPARRFQNLTELKTALIPFASKGTSLANFGRRLAAFTTDYLLVQVVILAAVFVAATWIRIRIEPQGNQENLDAAIAGVSFYAMLSSWFLTVVYFGLTEGLSGRTIGKKILGLSVVDQRGQRPGFWRALLRAAVVPGCFGLTLLFALFHTQFMALPTNAASIFASWVAWFSVQAVILTICLIPMRTKNDFRGLQGSLSGTRVYWHPPEELDKLDVPRVEPTANTIKKMTFGPYQTNELLGTSRLGKVYLAYDETLKRDIWVVASGDSPGPRQVRINLARPGRQRWLAGGVDPENGRWDAIQAIHGFPIQALVGINQSVSWKHYRAIMRQVANELIASLKDTNLPNELTLPQIWVDSHCRAVLLDRRLVNLVSDENEFATSEAQRPADERAVRLLQELADLIQRTQQKHLPLSAQVFLTQLANQPRNEKTLQWAVEELEGMSDNLAAMDWDSRAGILGTTVGLEFLIYGISTAIAFSICLRTSSPVPGFLKGMLISLILPTIGGMWFRGGLVFRFMNINVCDKWGKLATPFQCAVRSIAAWFPPLAFVGFLTLIMLMRGGLDPDPATNEVSNGESNANNLNIIRSIVWAWALLTLNVAGLMFALRSPTRGFQDYVAGTKLIPE